MYGNQLKGFLMKPKYENLAQVVDYYDSISAKVYDVIL